MQHYRWIRVLTMVAVAAFAMGCGDDEKKGEKGSADKAAPEVKLARVDLSSAGLPLTIEAPAGARVSKEEGTGEVSVRKGKTFEVLIAADPGDIAEARKFAKENDVVKLKRFLVDTADTVFYESEMAGMKQYRFLTNVKVGDKVYSVKEGAVGTRDKAQTELMFKCARTLAAKPGAAPVPAKAPGPKEVALAVWKAMEAGDGQIVADHHDCPDDDKAFLKQFVPIMSKMAAFANAGIKAYGKDAWVAAAKKAEMADLANPPIPPLAGADKKIQCKIEGDKATCTLEGAAEPLLLVKKGGSWLVARAEGDELPPKAGRKTLLAQAGAMAKAMDSVMGKIGQAGVTADKVFEEFVQAMAKAMPSP